ncbi:hypothetical protein GCM10027289_05260 [Tsukamurella serpentis]
MEYLKLGWNVLKRRWYVPVLALALAATAVGLTVGFFPPEKQASATMFLRAPDVKTSASAYQGDLFSRQRIQTYRDFVTSPDLARMVIKRLAVGETPGQLIAKTTATSNKDTVLLTISVTDPDAQHAADLANGYAAVFADYVAQMEHVQNNPDVPPLATLVSPADARDATTTGMKLWVLLSAAGAGAVVLSLLAIWLLEYCDRRVRSRRQVENAVGAPVLGVIPPAAALSGDDVDDEVTDAVGRIAVNLGERVREQGTLLVVGVPADADAEGVATLLDTQLRQRNATVSVVTGPDDLGSAEFASAVAEADGVLVVAVAGRTNATLLAQAAREAELAGTPIVGAVVNRSRQTATPAGVYV